MPNRLSVRFSDDTKKKRNQSSSSTIATASSLAEPRMAMMMSFIDYCMLSDLATGVGIEVKDR